MLANVRLTYSLPEMLSIATQTKKVARRIRMVLAATNLYSRASALTAVAQNRFASPSAQKHVQASV